MTLVAAVFSVLLVCPSSMPADVGSYSAQNCCSIWYASRNSVGKYCFSAVVANPAPGELKWQEGLLKQG